MHSECISINPSSLFITFSSIACPHICSANKKKKKKTNEEDDIAMASGMLRQVFDALDRNHDGFLSPDEIMDFLFRLGVKFSPDRMIHLLLLSSSHVNPAHGLLFEDFLAFYIHEDITGMASHDAEDKEEEKNENGEEEELLAAFGVIDRDGDRLISGTDLRGFLIQTNLKVGVTLQDCEEMIKRVDEDGDGHIDFLEFKHMMSSGSSAFI